MTHIFALPSPAQNHKQLEASSPSPPCSRTDAWRTGRAGCCPRHCTVKEKRTVVRWRLQESFHKAKQVGWYNIKFSRDQASSGPRTPSVPRVKMSQYFMPGKGLATTCQQNRKMVTRLFKIITRQTGISAAHPNLHALDPLGPRVPTSTTILPTNCHNSCKAGLPINYLLDSNLLLLKRKVGPWKRIVNC